MTAAEKLSAHSAGSERNLVELLIARCSDARGPAVTHKVGNAWVDVTWASILEQVRRVSAGLTAAGVKHGDRVAIFGATTLQWVVCDLAISASRAVCVPIYASNTPDEVRYILPELGCLGAVRR